MVVDCLVEVGDGRYILDDWPSCIRIRDRDLVDVPKIEGHLVEHDWDLRT